MSFLDKNGLSRLWANILVLIESRASKTELDTHVEDTTKHITSDERANWNAAYDLAANKVTSLSDLGITATATELNYMQGVTSNVQEQLDNKSKIQIVTWEADD